MIAFGQGDYVITVRGGLFICLLFGMCAGVCVDYPQAWNDVEGCGCDAYEEAGMCIGGHIAPYEQYERISEYRRRLDDATTGKTKQKIYLFHIVTKHNTPYLIIKLD